MSDYKRFVLGNSLELLPTFDDNSFDYVFTSPPYNRKRNDKYEFYNDSVDYLNLLSIVIDESLRISREHVFINVQKNYYNKQDVFKVIGKYADKLVDIIIWNKTNPMPASGLNITNSYEFVLVFGNKPLKARHTYTTNTITTSVYSNNPYKKIHRAVMSDKFANEFFQRFITPGKIVLDPFAGMGTTGVACVENGNDFVAIEISKEYLDIARERVCEME